VELHQGQVEATAKGGAKAAASPVFPRQPIRAGGALPAAVAPKAARPAQAASRKILVVDDLAASAETLKVCWSLKATSSASRMTAPPALALAREFRPDVVILDIGLPGMDGFEVARQLRSRPESKDAVLIALTGYGEAESRLKSQRAGFDHHVVKPADIDFLLSIVSQPAA
jgi:CheY-like chemotaxis protein